MGFHDFLCPDPAAISKVLLLFETGPPEAGYLSRAVNLLDGRFVKTSRKGLTLRKEALAMEFVRLNTTIPVPKVHMLFDHEGVTYLVMDAISGITLQAASFQMKPTVLQKTAQQLRKVVDQLQSLTLDFPSPSDNYYGQWPGTPFAYHNKRFKFKDTVPSFQTFRDLLSYILHSPSDKMLTTVLERELTGNATRAVLTHSDLSPHNIIVDKDSGDILAILDWEMFGWYPAYWERMFVLKSCAHAQLRSELERTFDGALEQHLEDFAWKVLNLNAESYH